MTAAMPMAIQFPSGLMSRIPESIINREGFDFKVSLLLKGSQGIYFTPVANTTTIEISSTWPAPKFERQFLPDTSTITKDGFNARWTVLDINRQLSQQWTDATPE